MCADPGSDTPLNKLCGEPKARPTDTQYTKFKYKYSEEYVLFRLLLQLSKVSWTSTWPTCWASLR